MPPSPLLYDAVTLRHFSSCGRLDICEQLHAALPTPRWVEEVEREIRRANSRFPECSAILAAPWLGSPMAPTGTTEQLAIRRLQIRLNGGASGDLGEAQSIYFAGIFGGTFATDDNTAFSFAERSLGAGRVVDTVDILRQAVAVRHISRTDAASVVTAIRSSGRHLRRARNSVRTAADF